MINCKYCFSVAGYSNYGTPKSLTNLFTLESLVLLYYNFVIVTDDI